MSQQKGVLCREQKVPMSQVEICTEDFGSEAMWEQGCEGQRWESNPFCTKQRKQMANRKVQQQRCYSCAPMPTVPRKSKKIKYRWQNTEWVRWNVENFLVWQNTKLSWRTQQNKATSFIKQNHNQYRNCRQKIPWEQRENNSTLLMGETTKARVKWEKIWKCYVL